MNNINYDKIQNDIIKDFLNLSLSALEYLFSLSILFSNGGEARSPRSRGTAVLVSGESSPSAEGRLLAVPHIAFSWRVDVERERFLSLLIRPPIL